MHLAQFSQRGKSQFKPSVTVARCAFVTCRRQSRLKITTKSMHDRSLETARNVRQTSNRTLTKRTKLFSLLTIFLVYYIFPLLRLPYFIFKTYSVTKIIYLYSPSFPFYVSFVSLFLFLSHHLFLTFPYLSILFLALVPLLYAS